jgi:hypothetical protein
LSRYRDIIARVVKKVFAGDLDGIEAIPAELFPDGSKPKDYESIDAGLT